MTETPSRLAGYRHRRDHFFGSHAHSPLTDEQREKFSGLDYFPEREDLVLALEMDESGETVGEEVVLDTTDGQHKHFFRAGVVNFEVDGQPVALTMLRDERGGLFLPVPRCLGRQGNVRGRPLSGAAETARWPSPRGSELRLQPVLCLWLRVELSDPAGGEPDRHHHSGR